MSVLPELEAQLRAAAHRTQPRRRARRTWLLATVAVLLSGASLATAAVQLAGDPAPRTAPAGTRHSGPGLTLPSSVRLLAVRAPDPDGGPPWGIRVWRTSRQAACWQLGRVVDGRLGLLGADGRFHELPLQQEQCQPLDGRGHLLALQEPWMLATGQGEPWACAPAERPPVSGRPSCPPGSVRLVRYGFLGPEATSIRLGGELRSRPLTTDGYAAFLLVERADLGVPSLPPPIVVNLRDGTSTPARSFIPDDPQDGPLPPGFSPLGDALPANVAAPLRLTASPRGKDVIYTLRFRAPVATRRYGVAYRVLISGPRGGRRCDEKMDFAGFDTPGDVRAGRRITIKLTPGLQIRYGHGWCRGRYRGTVILHDTAHVVGRFSFVQR